MTQAVSQGYSLPPESIRDAIVRVTDPTFPVNLAASVRLAFTFLLRRVECTNGRAEFWVKRMNLADTVGKCEKTISNWLNELEEAGLISKEQPRTHWGAFRCLTVRLTDYAVKLLDLATSKSDFYARRKNYSHAHIPVQSKETVACNSPAKAEERPTAEGLSNRLPVDLQDLVSDALPASAIFKLMGKASSRGKRLSDVVQVCRHNIVKARMPYAYLLSLLSKNKDYASLAASQQSANVEAKKASTDEEEINQVWKYLEGTSVAWRGRSVVVGAPRQACMMYEVGVDGKKTYCGALSGQALLRFINDQRVAPEDESGVLRP